MVNERHQIYLNKKAGEPQPWSEDPIFQNWKFCNVFRSLDKQSQFLIDKVIEPHQDDDIGLLLFNIFAFRAFNLYDTFHYINNKDWIDSWNEQEVIDALYTRVEKFHKPLTSGAYMIRGFHGQPKWFSIPKVLTHIWNRKTALAKEIEKRHSLEHCVEILTSQKFWGWGPFTCYQVALDLTYTRILSWPGDINEWCMFGPGGERGLKIIYPEILKSKHLEGARELLRTQGMWLKDYMPAMNLQDIEFCLCEFQKYRRVLNGGKSKEKYDGR